MGSSVDRIIIHSYLQAEALTVAHIEATKKIIDYLTHCDGGGQ